MTWDPHQQRMVAAAPRRTSGWAWGAGILVALIPIGFVVAVVWLFTASSGAAEDDPSGMDGEWLPLAAGFGFIVWAGLCAAGAVTCGLIAAWQARRT